MGRTARRTASLAVIFGAAVVAVCAIHATAALAAQCACRQIPEHSCTVTYLESIEPNGRMSCGEKSRMCTGCICDPTGPMTCELELDQPRYEFTGEGSDCVELRRDIAQCPASRGVECAGPKIEKFEAPSAVDLGAAISFSVDIVSSCFSSWSLTFDDGTAPATGTGLVAAPTHTFYSCGDHVSRLTAVDKHGRAVDAEVAVEVQCAPTATPTPAPCAPPQITGFEVDAQTLLGSSTEFAFEISSECMSDWELQFGDTSAATTGTQMQGLERHTYATCSETTPFVATLTVSDTEGRTDTRTAQILVRCPAPTAAPPTAPPVRPICGPPEITTFTAPTHAQMGQSVPFQIAIESGCFEHWTLHFSDGSTSLRGVQQTATTEHTYVDCGIQRVELVAQDQLMQTMTSFVEIDIACPATATPLPKVVETECYIDDNVGWTLECVVPAALIPDGATVTSAYMITEQTDNITFWLLPAGYRGYTVTYQTTTSIQPAGWFEKHPWMPEFSLSASQSDLEPFVVSGSNDVQVSQVAALQPFLNEVNRNKRLNEDTVITFKTNRLTSVRRIRKSKLEPLTSAMRVAVVLNFD
eukprot:CAMPEP_0185833690 /NCGR_PEP_ID=MMETSP1353-20130828/3318_1 /TAXON_ID=1077150 /ORGANISM="Erythrolobus australicus, Strain CCMP3124" /LENGTH=583 /DNA_ID=CAMNT_0028532009 /DNA_START=145 /DNA_END=1896 /DNA_ORIENTATION=+